MAFMGPLGTPSNNNWILVRIVEFTDVFHITGQTVEAVPAVRTLQGFIVNIVFHERVVVQKKAELDAVAVMEFNPHGAFTNTSCRTDRFAVNAWPLLWIVCLKGIGCCLEDYFTMRVSRVEAGKVELALDCLFENLLVDFHIRPLSKHREIVKSSYYG
jgi:hypothetical protein